MLLVKWLKDNEGQSREMDRKDWMGEIWFSVHVTLRNDAGKALATDREQTADVAHKLSGCFTSRVWFL